MKMEKNAKLSTFLKIPHTKKFFTKEDKANENRVKALITNGGGVWNTCMGRTHHYQVPT
jgi:hypothetical protein